MASPQRRETAARPEAPGPLAVSARQRGAAETALLPTILKDKRVCVWQEALPQPRARSLASVLHTDVVLSLPWNPDCVLRGQPPGSIRPSRPRECPSPL